MEEEIILIIFQIIMALIIEILRQSEIQIYIQLIITQTSHNHLITNLYLKLISLIKNHSPSFKILKLRTHIQLLLIILIQPKINIKI